MNNNYLSEEKNPEYLLSSTHTELLLKIINGEIDPKELAWNELRNRGLDASGVWCGFGKDKIKKPF